MRREIEQIWSPKKLDECCPGHDRWPNDTYKNSRSKRARSRDMAREHRYVRREFARQLRTGQFDNDDE